MPLEDDEDDQHRDECHEGGGKYLSPFGEVLALEEGDTDRQRPLAGISDRHVCPGKLLPAI